VNEYIVYLSKKCIGVETEDGHIFEEMLNIKWIPLLCEHETDVHDMLHHYLKEESLIVKTIQLEGKPCIKLSFELEYIPGKKKHMDIFLKYQIIEDIFLKMEKDGYIHKDALDRFVEKKVELALKPYIQELNTHKMLLRETPLYFPGADAFLHPKYTTKVCVLSPFFSKSHGYHLFLVDVSNKDQMRIFNINQGKDNIYRGYINGLNKVLYRGCDTYINQAYVPHAYTTLRFNVNDKGHQYHLPTILSVASDQHQTMYKDSSYKILQGESIVLDNLQYLLELEELYIINDTTTQDYSFLRHLTKLKILHICGSATLKDLTFVSHLSKLEELRIDHCDQTVNVSGIDALQHLKVFSYEGTAVIPAIRRI
jgi:hypothetical protein